MILGINTTSDISKLLYVISNLRQFWNITSGIYAKYHVQIMLLFVYTTTHKRSVIFTCRYFKLSWSTTALSQSNSCNFSYSSIKGLIMHIKHPGPGSQELGHCEEKNCVGAYFLFQLQPWVRKPHAPVKNCWRLAYLATYLVNWKGIAFIIQNTLVGF